MDDPTEVDDPTGVDEPTGVDDPTEVDDPTGVDEPTGVDDPIGVDDPTGVGKVTENEDLENANDVDASVESEDVLENVWNVELSFCGSTQHRLGKSNWPPDPQPNE